MTMARQPQVVTAVIRPCNSPVPNNTKRHGMAQYTSIHAKSKSSESSHQKQTRPQSSSNASLKGNFAKPTASTLLKSRCPLNASSDGRTKHPSKARAPVGPPKRKTIQNSSSNASAPVTMQKPRKRNLPAAARRRATSPSGKSQRSGTAASSTAGSTKQRSSPVSSRSGSPRKSTSLSSRAPQTSSAGRKSSRISAASTRTRYPAMSSATSDSARRRSPSPSAASECSDSSRAESPRLVRSASQEARLNKLKSHIDHLRQTSPLIASPEFTSTRTNLAGRGQSPSPGQRPTADTTPWHLTGNSSALFGSPPRPGARPRSRSDSRSRSPSPGGAARAAARRRTGTTTWTETRNRASALGGAGQAGSRASPPPTWQSKRHLPRVAYPRPSPAAALRARSSSSQTRRSASGDERVTLRSRGGRHASPSSRASGTSDHRPARTPAGTRHPIRTPGNSRYPNRTPGNTRDPNRTPGNTRHHSRTPASPRRAVRTPTGRVAAPSTIDYSPQSRYMAGLLKQGAVRRPAGKENRLPAGSSGSESSRAPRAGGSAGRQGLSRGAQWEAGRRPSAASQRSAASEPVQSPRKPARSILRTSVSSHRTASDPAPGQYGYDWVSDMLDLSAPLPKSKKDVQAARKFRDKNWADTHSRGPGRGTAGDSSSGQQPDGHKCVHEYYINSRLFPTPLYTDSGGRSQCPVCLAVGASPTGPARRSLSPGAAGRGARSRSPGSVRGHRSRSRSPVPSRTGVRSRSPSPARAASFGAPSRRARSRSPAGCRPGRPRSRSNAAPRRVSPARRRSSVSWHDEVAPASSAAAARSERSHTSLTSRTGRAGRARSPSGSVCVTCPNCHHLLPLSAAELSDALSDSLEPPRGRRAARGPAPAPSPPPRLQAARCPGEEPRGPPSPGPAGRQRRSPVTLRSRTPASRQPVKAMFTVPTALFQDAREDCGSCGGGGGVAGWDAAGSAADPDDPTDLGRTRAGHPLWPRQLDLSPAGVRPIARGWPRHETRGNLGRPADPLRRAAAAQLQTGRNAAPRRSVQNSGGGAKNSYSLRRCIGEKM